MQDWSKADWVDPALGWVPRPVPDLPPRVIVDFATRCNLRCRMCPVWSLDDASIESVKGIMDAEAARAMLDELAEAPPLIQPNLYGEPLLIPHLRERVREMKARGMSIAMNTNGLNLTDALARFLVEEAVDSVMFSLDAVNGETLMRIRGVNKLAKIEDAVARLMAVRGEREKPRIGVSFTLQDENRHEQDAFVARWVGKVDVVRINLLYKDGTFPDVRPDGERQPCPALYSTLPVHNDGQVTLCCLDGMRQTDMGNVFEQGVAGVWQGEAFARARYYHETGQWDRVPFCKPCNGWAQHAFTEEIKDGLLIRRSAQFVYYNTVDRLTNWRGSLLGNHPPPPVLEETTA